jgi:hypothetical protein
VWIAKPRALSLLPQTWHLALVIAAEGTVMRRSGWIPAWDVHVAAMTARTRRKPYAALLESNEPARANIGFREIDAMNQRKMTLVVTTLAALSTPAFAQTAAPTVVSPTDQSDLALNGTQTPVVAGASTATTGTVTDAPAGGSGVATAFSVNAPAVNAPVAGNTSAAGEAAGSPPLEATASATGMPATTGSTMDCASLTAVVGVSPGQMPSACAP